jgi:hypothetical protein
VNTPPSPVDQILALLTGGATRLVQERCGKSHLTGADYRATFTVDRKDVREYVETCGLPMGTWSSSAASSDGLYLIELDGRYATYYQERGIAFTETLHATRAQAELAVADLLLNASGTGLFTADVARQAVQKPHWWRRLLKLSHRENSE